MLALSLWLAEFLLEAAGSYLAFRKRTFPLAFYLAFRAVSDIATGLIFSATPTLYPWSYWFARAGAAVLLCWLASSLVAKMMGEGRYGVYGVILCIALAGGVTFFSAHESTLDYQFLTGAAVADGLLGLMLLLGLMDAKVRPDQQTALIAWGVCIHLGTDGLLVGLAHVWLGALAWLPVGAVAALVVWILAMRMPDKLSGEVRLPLPPKIHITAFLFDEYPKEC